VRALAPATGTPSREACLAAMRAHASSAARAPHLDAFYGLVARWCGPVSSVADLACGLNPLAIPWLALAAGATYEAWEVDLALAAALNELGPAMGPALRCHVADLVARPPAVRAELALLLQAAPTLDQQRAGATTRVLDALDCEHVVVSLPRRSLSGRRAYRNDALALLGPAVARTPYRLGEVAAVGDEWVAHLARRPA
ncbi:MAG: hypothetical protein ACRD0M_02740, partial [Acidimicrobiales bacterium]